MHCRELAGAVGLAYKIIQDGKGQIDFWKRKQVSV